MRSTFVPFLLLFATTSLAAQTTLTETIRGQVLDADTELGLPGANVILLGSDPLIGATTDADGYFRLDQVPVGRHTLKCTFIGYSEQVASNLLLTSGKQLVIEFKLVEKVVSGDALTVTAFAERDLTATELSSVSIQDFDSEVASRYAGSRSDVARMAAGFAGVSANDDSRNDIVVRGNSPAGLLWRLNGVDIPNPSHFGALGATGGPVSMLNNNQLSTSSFLTGAYPANFGNALSGVFDLWLRKGNEEKIEGLGQVGFNGFEAGLEGPLPGNGASFLINYRYSVIDLIDKIAGDSGPSTGTGSAIPEYNDLSYHLHLPTKSLGTWSAFGVTGNSAISFKADTDGEDANLFTDSNENLDYQTRMTLAALSNKHYFNDQSFGRASLSLSISGAAVQVDTVGLDESLMPVYRDDSVINRLRFAYDYKNKLSSRASLSAGANASRFDFNLKDSIAVAPGVFRTERDFEGASGLYQGYLQGQYKFSERFLVNFGGFGQFYDFNETWSVEPRVGLVYDLSSRLSLSFGAGRHSKLQDFQSYFYETPLANGSVVRTNRDLDFTRSDQIIAGLEWSPARLWNVKGEIYAQRLNDIPVDIRSSDFSAANLGADFAPAARDSLINNGTGENHGLELTLERSFGSGRYLLGTLSWFESTYEGSDGITRSTAFDGTYVANILAGQEFQLNSKLSFAVDAKVTLAGGKPFTPIDLAASRLANDTVLQTGAAFSERYKDYSRADLKFTLRYNSKRFSQEWSVDLQNAFDTENPFSQAYNPRSGKIDVINQLERFMVIDYRIRF